MEKKAVILMSTYNGEKYLGEQIESLLNQSYKNIKILIRDDGSEDGTVEILQKYREKYPEIIEMDIGKNIGVVSSFFKLILSAEEKNAYYCLCDQDDCWLPEKIEKGIKELEKGLSTHENRAGLYFSNLTLVDSSLNYIGPKMKKSPEINLQKSFFQNDLYGCTGIFTGEYLEILKEGIKKADFSKIIFHDHFIYIVGNLFGKIMYDHDSHILYRQHSGNVSGAHLNRIGKIKKIWKKYGKQKSLIYNQCLEIKEIYGSVIKENHMVQIEEILNLKKSLLKRISFMMNKNPYSTNSLMGEIAVYLAVIFNRF